MSPEPTELMYQNPPCDSPFEYRDAQKSGGEHRNTLEQEGGQIKVPCLRIDDGDKTTWLYESKEIIAYLNKQFDASLNQA